MTQLKEPEPRDIDAIYSPDWRRRVEDYVLHAPQRAEITRYWAFDLERAWTKHRTAVARKLAQARMIAHWMPPENRRVLVMGSALGDEAIAWALLGARVTAIDLDEWAVKLSNELAGRWGVDIDARCADACDAPFPDAGFDLVNCAQVIEHVPRERQPVLLREIWRLGKPGGLFWVDTPNQHNPKDRHDTGLWFLHWLPRPLKTRLALRLRRAVNANEPAFGFAEVALHYYLSYFGLMRTLRKLGPCEVLSRYRGFADADHYAEGRRREGRGGGKAFALKVALMRLLLRVWPSNWWSDMRLVIRKGEG